MGFASVHVYPRFSINHYCNCVLSPATLHHGRLLDIVHADQKLYLVFEFLDVDLKRYMEHASAGGIPLTLDITKVSNFIFLPVPIALEVVGWRPHQFGRVSCTPSRPIVRLAVSNASTIANGSQTNFAIYIWRCHWLALLLGLGLRPQKGVVSYGQTSCA